MSKSKSSKYVSRGGEKLAAALNHFEIDVSDLVCADLGSHVGGFVDCLVQRGAARVYSVDTSYGTLAWKLRRDPRIVVLERTNAMHVVLPEPVDLVTIDVGWTPQSKILPGAAGLLRPRYTQDGPPIGAAPVGKREPTAQRPLPNGRGSESDRPAQSSPTKPAPSRGTDKTGSNVLTLIKPHYEALKDQLDAGVLPNEWVDGVVHDTVEQMKALGWHVVGTVESPMRGHAGNREFFALLSRAVR